MQEPESRNQMGNDEMDTGREEGGKQVCSQPDAVSQVRRGMEKSSLQNAVPEPALAPLKDFRMAKLIRIEMSSGEETEIGRRNYTFSAARAVSDGLYGRAIHENVLRRLCLVFLVRIEVLAKFCIRCYRLIAESTRERRGPSMHSSSAA
ncbi:hypothetical protein RvY_06725 [Ramazzottius varieornatus]|uniref:Uncharacterized protein n=1 Tax=Ramazzottius varieornatus TaxID=947166 RepID=A0A1D1V4Z3_RAMVA|nr:hypothetical protein RvY_06725 [Ramazzottius varieornatus]